MSSMTPTLSEVEALAAKCLVNAGLLTQRFKSLEVTTGPLDKETRDLRLSLFEAAQSLLQSVTPPEYVLTQQLSGSVSSSITSLCRAVS
jgi:hypothetical protein